MPHRVTSRHEAIKDNDCCADHRWLISQIRVVVKNKKKERRKSLMVAVLLHRMSDHGKYKYNTIKCLLYSEAWNLLHGTQYQKITKKEIKTKTLVSSLFLILRTMSRKCLSARQHSSGGEFIH